jgi:KUP system potassium uptake protein
VRHTYAFVSLIGAGLLLGDGVITPSISVLSAIEGLELLGSELNSAVVPLTVVVLICLFMSQRFGTAKVGIVFGPIMVQCVILLTYLYSVLMVYYYCHTWYLSYLIKSICIGSI